MNNVLKIFILLIFVYSCDQPVEIVKHAPVIHSINPGRTLVYTNDSVDIEAHVTDEDQGDKLSYYWQSSSGHFVNSYNNPTCWYAPEYPDSCTISLTVSDGYFEVSKSIIIIVVIR